MTEDTQRLLEALKAKRTAITEKVAWCCVLPPLGWFGRIARLDRDHERVHGEINRLIRQARAASRGSPNDVTTKQ